MSRALLPLYAGLTTLAAPLLRLHLRRRARRGKEIAARLPERRGIEATPRPAGKLIWLHAASMGETTSILPVIEALFQLRPELTVLVTTGTVTSAELLAGRRDSLAPPGRLLHRFIPLDVPSWVARFLDHWRPDAGALVESELWPNLLVAARRRHIPLLLVNGRMSPGSYKNWRRWPSVARSLFGGFVQVQAQSRHDGERFTALGARQVTVPGNLKFAAPALPVDHAELTRLVGLLGDRPVWLAAQTHPGEEEIAIAVHRALASRHPRLLTVIAPRHVDRGAEIAELAAGLAVTRRSQGEDPPTTSGLWIADTMGELGLLYRAVPIVFVGCSLTVFGGHNPLEPARLGCAVAVGPHTANCIDSVIALQEAGALAVVANPAGLQDWVGAMLADPNRRRAMGAAGIAASSRTATLPADLAATLLDLAGVPP